LISGLHTSITCHIAKHYLLDDKNHIWGENLALFNEQVRSHPSRIKNLFFLYLFVFRAVSKLSPYLSEHNYNTQFEKENKEIKKLMHEIRQFSVNCPATFDETIMFQDQDSIQLKKEFKNHFRNISSILDCVICEKCRLWGKLQINGIATALKILFELNTPDPSPSIEEINDSSEFEKKISISQEVQLERTEIIALINIFKKLSESLSIVHEMNNSIKKVERPIPQPKEIPNIETNVLVITMESFISTFVLIILTFLFIYKYIIKRCYRRMTNVNKQ